MEDFYPGYLFFAGAFLLCFLTLMWSRAEADEPGPADRGESLAAPASRRQVVDLELDLRKLEQEARKSVECLDQRIDELRHQVSSADVMRARAEQFGALRERQEARAPSGRVPVVIQLPQAPPRVLEALVDRILGRVIALEASVNVPDRNRSHIVTGAAFAAGLFDPVAVEFDDKPYKPAHPQSPKSDDSPDPERKNT